MTTTLMSQETASSKSKETSPTARNSNRAAQRPVERMFCRSWMMQARKQIGSPERQQQKDKRPHRTVSEAPAALREHLARRQQRQIHQPEKSGPHHFGIVPIGHPRRPRQVTPRLQTDGEQHKSGKDQPHRN